MPYEDLGTSVEGRGGNLPVKWIAIGGVSRNR
jgi:hypothetical protein